MPFPYKFWNAAPIFNKYQEEQQKLQAIFCNPALLKIFTLQCDLFSLAKVYVYNGETLKPNDVALDRFKYPNPLQNQSQWLWDYMFWKMLGNAHLYMSSKDVNRDNAPMYWLEPYKIDWPPELEKKKDQLILSKSKLKEINDTIITYRYDDGNTIKFTLSELKTVFDLTNGTGNFYKGNSRIDSLYKVISNSEISLDSKNINVRYTAKFLVAGQQDPNDVTSIPMSEDEKDDIEKKTNGESWHDKMHGEKQVHAVKSMVDIKRFVSDLRVLELDKSFLSDFFLIGSMYNIPRDVLELYVSSTYENQEKARAGHVSYTLEPAGEQLACMLAKEWGYTGEWKIVLSWDHLPFTQVFEQQRAQIAQTKANTAINMLRSGFSMGDINEFLDTDFSEVIPPEPTTNPNKSVNLNGKTEKLYEKTN